LCMFDVSKFICAHLVNVRPYIPGKPVDEVKRDLGLTCEIIKLASNENPIGPSPMAVESIKKELPTIWKYPEDSVFYLKKALAEYHDVPVECIVVGNGMIEIIHLIAQACLGAGDEAIMGQPCFIAYKTMCQMHDAKAIEVHHPDYKNDLELFYRHLTDRTKLIWIDNPNNPTGTYCSRDEVDTLIDKVDSRALIVLDEAYYHFCNVPDFPDAVEYVKQDKSVIALRTFSKVAGLAGIRCGYGIMHPDIAAILDTLRITFSVNVLAQAAALAAMKDTIHMEKSKRMVFEGRKYFYENLDKIGLRYKKTLGNYVWIIFDHDAKEITEFLLQNGVIVRPGWIFGSPNCIRVSISDETENLKFFEILNQAIGTRVPK
jgi:histidinol-phosphate aminotransferase